MDTERLALHQVNKDKNILFGLNIALAVTGLVLFIVGVATTIISDWLNIIVGLCFICVGGGGIYVNRKRSDSWSALWFYRVLLIVIALVALLGIVFLGVGLGTPCASSSSSDFCTAQQNGYLTAGLITIILTMVGVGFCAYFAKMFVDDLSAYTHYTKHMASGNDMEESLDVPPEPAV